MIREADDVACGYGKALIPAANYQIRGPKCAFLADKCNSIDD